MSSTKSKSSSKADPDKKIFDISKPGKSAPSASSKSIIITNRPVLRDPMVVDESTGTKSEAVQSPAQPSTRIKIAPLDETLKTKVEPDQPSPPEENSVPQPEEPAPEEKEPETGVEKPAESEPDDDEKPAESEADKDEKPAETESSAEVNGTDSSNQEDTTPKEDPEESAEADGADDKIDVQKPISKADEEAARKAAERQAELEKVIESKKYFLPINQVGKRRNKRDTVSGVLLIIVLLLIWADLALDAGLIHLSGVKPLTHLFTQ